MQILLANAKIMFDKADRKPISVPLFQSVANVLAEEMARMNVEELAGQLDCSSKIFSSSFGNLLSLPVEGLTVSEVKGFGRQKGHTELYRGAEYQVDFLPKVKLEIATADDNVEGVIEAICKAAYTGKIGDGKIFVYDLLQAVRIRTGESDDEAL